MQLEGQTAQELDSMAFSDEGKHTASFHCFVGLPFVTVTTEDSPSEGWMMLY